MFQSVIVKNTFASIASVVVVVDSPPPPPSRRLRALSRPRRRCRPCCHIVSSHPFGMLYIYNDRSKGSCNQGRKVLSFYCVSSGATPPPLKIKARIHRGHSMTCWGNPQAPKLHTSPLNQI